MSNLLVRAITYQALPVELYAEYQGEAKAFGDLTTTLMSQVDEMLANTNVAAEDITRHFLCSTMVELPMTTGKISWKAISASMREAGSQYPDTFVNAYECASWGYSLRHYLKHQARTGRGDASSRFLMVSIIDANIYNLEFWRYNEHWEHSGFGITTFLLELTGELTDELSIMSAATHNSMAEFATVVRRTAAKKEQSTLAMPFFPKNIQTMFKNLLGGKSRLPDLHADWGHCFGSDPWLSLLMNGLDNPLKENTSFLACSLALNGYFAIAEVVMTPETQLLLKKEWCCE